jgi:SlyX protein
MVNAQANTLAKTQVTETMIDLEGRIEALESRNVFQDDVIEQLSKELAIHQAQIADIVAQLALLANRLKESGTSQAAGQEIEPPPPHF